MSEALPEVVARACRAPQRAASSLSKVNTVCLKSGSSGRP